jgi:hydroxymethylglutaryl-CoA synthase
MTAVGIDDIAIHVPRVYLDMRDFAELREADYAKLNRGLGLSAMAIPDVHEDTATMGANAAARLIDRNGLDPRRIGRIYLGTESALDGAKPTATYVLDMLRTRYAEQHGADCFAHCDVVDLTFACIGAVDALHNTLDWVARGGPDEDRIGIVVFSDNAKYDRHSSGEYTQGAGGGAILVRHRPRLLAIPDVWGVSTNPVHDFFKPRRAVAVHDLVDEVLALAREAGAEVPEGLLPRMLAALAGSAPRQGVFQDSPRVLQLHKDTPVFDGPFSNRCYRDAVKSAFVDFQRRAEARGDYDDASEPLTEQWQRIILHLPYAFQGKRMFPDVFRHDRRGTAGWDAIVEQIGSEPVDADFDDEAAFHRASDAYRRAISKTPQFRQFVAERIEKGQRASSLIGNQYTGSIFLALMSTLESDLQDGTELAGASLGLCGYGSGAKAKVFTAVVQPGWKAVVGRFELFERLTGRRALTVQEYEALHRGEQAGSVVTPRHEFALVDVEETGELAGRRAYAWVA